MTGPTSSGGPQHHRAWIDELAKYQYPEETWNQLQLGLRLGDDPRNVVTTTPRPIPLIKDLVERHNVVVTTGSTFDNANNLADSSFLEEVRRQYEGTRLGEQELFGRIVEFEGESVFKRGWWDQPEFRYDPAEEAARLWNRTIARYASLDTAATVGESSAFTALTVGDLHKDDTVAAIVEQTMVLNVEERHLLLSLARRIAGRLTASGGPESVAAIGR